MYHRTHKSQKITKTTTLYWYFTCIYVFKKVYSSDVYLSVWTLVDLTLVTSQVPCAARDETEQLYQCHISFLRDDGNINSCTSSVPPGAVIHPGQCHPRCHSGYLDWPWCPKQIRCGNKGWPKWKSTPGRSNETCTTQDDNVRRYDFSIKIFLMSYSNAQHNINYYVCT